MANPSCEGETQARIVRPKNFRELLIDLPEKGDDEIEALLRKANVARFEAPFLLENDQGIQSYWEELCKQITDDVIGNSMFPDAVRNEAALMNDPQAVRDIAERSSRLSSARIEIPDRHLRELPQRFAQFMNLTDFSK